MRFNFWTFARLSIFALLALSGVDEGRAEQIIKTNELSADTLVVLQRGACERRCAVYKLVIFSDGAVIFDGLSYVRKPGLAKSKIGLEALKALLDAADALKFSDLQARYDEASGCDLVNADAPVSIITIVTNGKSKTIRHSLGCSGAEAEHLKDLEDRIDTAVGSGRWLK